MNVDRVLEKVKTLPPMPAMAVRVLNAARDPDVDLSNLARWIEHDPSTTAHLLHLCNSPFYGLRGQVSSVRHAVSLIGLKQVVQLALTVISKRYLVEGQPGYSLGPGELLRNSIAAAIACELLAAEVRYESPSTAYTAGLLQDIGKVVLAEFVAASEAGIWAVAEKEALGFEEAESKQIGTSHPEVGALLLERWGFPDSLVEAVRFHHAPAKARIDPTLAKISHLADALTMTAGVGLGADGLAYRLDEETVRALNLSDPKRLNDLMERFVSRLRDAKDLLAT